MYIHDYILSKNELMNKLYIYIYLLKRRMFKHS